MPGGNMQEHTLVFLERMGRTCYKSEDRITVDSAAAFIRKLLKGDRWEKLRREIDELYTHASPDGRTVDAIINAVRAMLDDSPHESVIEHASMSVRFICDRGVTHELVRHRLCAFSQESTRYCNYSKAKFGNEITVIEPCFWRDDPDAMQRWQLMCEQAEATYLSMLDAGASPQEARSVLPNSLKTEIVCTANLREWRHIFRLRTSNRAHPQMREVMRPLLATARRLLPELFDDVGTLDSGVRP